jgi:ketosteroid isomerase-like protein
VVDEKNTATEETIRHIEERERCAVLAGDAAAIEDFWHPDLLVNGPHGSLLIGRNATLEMVKAGIIDFRRFDRTVECIQIEDGVAVTMGSETIEQKRGPQAGEVINRRFTNVWLFRDGKWWLRFRHANVAPDRPQVLTSDDA